MFIYCIKGQTQQKIENNGAKHIRKWTNIQQEHGKILIEMCRKPDKNDSKIVKAPRK